MGIPLGTERYVKASEGSDRELLPESTRRQFRTARDILTRLNGGDGQDARRGVLLADDVGLSKTTVAALVAWVVATAGEKRAVRVLAPNDVMMRRWDKELRSHVALLKKCAPTLDVRANRVKAGRVGILRPGSIQVVKHSYAASNSRLACDLLVVDEVHRAKGKGTAFSAALRRQKRHARRILILTATPFSIRLDELNRMLTLVGGEAAHGPVKVFSHALKRLDARNATSDPDHFAESLVQKARDVVDAISPFVIRHGIDDLPCEQRSFGTCRDWSISVPQASSVEIELIARVDRARRLSNGDGCESSKATNDPRFHVGWQHFDDERKRLRRQATSADEPIRAVVEHHLRAMARLRKGVGIHPKMAAVAGAVKDAVEQREKVVVFCDHHATAEELTVHLATVIPALAPSPWPEAVWMKAWYGVLEPAGHKYQSERLPEERLRLTFIEWLGSPLIRAQTWGWLPSSTSEAGLADALRTSKARDPRNPETIAGAAQRLYHAFLESRSSLAVLKQAEEHPECLPGAEGTSRVVGVCKPSGNGGEKSLFLDNRQPDTVISIFNSPFGPDVLVVTDRLSEGIDLHRYCRHLIHYELDPSPIRTVQRNGRLRRVGSWAAVTDQPIRYAYPSFGGTRDHRLVQIMRKRIDSFSLLLGGVHEFEVEAVGDAEEQWRSKVIEAAKSRLAKVGGRLRAREPGGA